MNMHTDPQKILEAERKDTYVPLSRPLSKEEREAFAAELDTLRRTMMAQTGEREASYIRRVRAMVRKSELAGRVLLMAYTTLRYFVRRLFFRTDNKKRHFRLK